MKLSTNGSSFRASTCIQVNISDVEACAGDHKMVHWTDSGVTVLEAQASKHPPSYMSTQLPPIKSRPAVRASVAGDLAVAVDIVNDVCQKS
jgi:hypothetical protein